MTITLKDVPMNKSQIVELTEALQSIADLIKDAYDAGHDDGYDEGYDAGHDDGYDAGYDDAGYDDADC